MPIGHFAGRREQARHASDPGRPLPDIRNPAEIQAYFLQEVQLGEELIAEGANSLFAHRA